MSTNLSNLLLIVYIVECERYITDIVITFIWLTDLKVLTAVLQKQT